MPLNGQPSGAIYRRAPIAGPGATPGRPAPSPPPGGFAGASQQTPSAQITMRGMVGRATVRRAAPPPAPRRGAAPGRASLAALGDYSGW
jgi:hypothetical protein